jgi:hypothetical protein
MSKTPRAAPDPAIATDPELARLEKRMRILHEVAEKRMAEVEALSKNKDPDALMETADLFLRLSDEVTGAIAHSMRLQERYRRRREKLEAERAKRVAAARVSFLAPDSPPGGTRH